MEFTTHGVRNGKRLRQGLPRVAVPASLLYTWIEHAVQGHGAVGCGSATCVVWYMRVTQLLVGKTVKGSQAHFSTSPCA